MPYYDYRCTACGTEFEIRRSMSQFDEAVACADCGSEKTERVFTPLAIGAVGGSSKGVDTAGASCGVGCGCHVN